MSTRRVVTLLCLALLAWLPSGTAQAGVGARFRPGTLTLQLVPAVAGVHLTADGNTAASNSAGVVRLPVRNFSGLARRLVLPAQTVAPDTRVELDRVVGDPDGGVRGTAVPVGLRVFRRVSWSFADRAGGPVPLDRISRLRLRNSMGEVRELSGGGLSAPLWVQSARPVLTKTGLLPKEIYYLVDRVVVEGSDAVNRGQQRFLPTDSRRWAIELLFYQVRVTTRDLLLGRPAGRTLTVLRPDGSRSVHPLSDGRAVLASVARGSYDLTVTGTPVSLRRPLQVSRDQEVELQVVTAVDLAGVGSLLLVVAFSLLLAGRPGLRRGLRQPFRRTRYAPAHARERPDGPAMQPATVGVHASPVVPAQRRRGSRTGSRAGLMLLVVLGLVVLPSGSGRPARADGGSRTAAGAATPVLAYYYIWYNVTSWNRAKIDYPLLGRYSSDEADVMRQHIRSARSAGVTAFLVSWKSTPVLNARLAMLVKVAREERFKLGVVYQGLDFSRKPLPAATVGSDLAAFARQYGSDHVFDVFGKPLVIWTGTEDFSVADLDAVTRPLRSRLLVLASAKSVRDYDRVADSFDGDAYYWASARPDRPAHRVKLAGMSAAVHARKGLWVAPAAPGFDARLVGGTSTVERNDGATLRASLAAARDSSPDAVGLISWNEFSENSYVEPSRRYGDRALRTLADVLGAGAVETGPQDSSAAPDHPSTGLTGLGAVVAGALGLGLFNVVLVLRRRRRRETAAADPMEAFERDLRSIARR